jgi:hypothetical protein
LDNFDEDWQKVNNIYNLSLPFDHHVGMHPTSADPNNVHKEFNILRNSTGHGSGSSSGSDGDGAYIKALCHLLLVDYVCFDYPLPEICQES